MCGICGFVRFDKAINEEDKGLVDKMNRKLWHRGPDAQDTFCYQNLAFGFSRLSIIGLENGMQPLINEDDTLILICNGEIFNYIELRKEMIQRGHVFKTDTDVEVIVHLYEEYGTSFLNQLNGQFAFALYDKKKQILFCARDHLGIIPFFYHQTDNLFVFGSEVKALLEHPSVHREIDLTGLDQVFTFAGLISPRTMFKDIKSLQNGHYLTVSPEGKVAEYCYWDLEYPKGSIPMNGKSEAAYSEELETHFENAVRLRLRADVPYGLYLSGGLDSSMIAMKVNEIDPGNRNKAFSIDFADSLHSESKYQKLVADKSNSELNQHVFLFDDIISRLADSIYYSECPIKETYNTASMALSANVRENGMKVVLSGEGADEFFAGYVGYRFDKMREMNLIENESSPEEEALRYRLWGDPAFYYERNFLEYEEEKRGLYSSALNDSFEEFNCLNHPLIDTSKVEGLDVTNRRAYIDYKVRLVDHLVSDHGDRMAMANSVEVRYPFLDKDLVEYSTKVPTTLKLNDFTEKYILRKMGQRLLPKEVFDREKFHFIAPGSPYLLQMKNEYINDILSAELISKQGFFNVEEIERLKKIYSQPGYKVNAPYENDQLITVITFGILLEKFFKIRI